MTGFECPYFMREDIYGDQFVCMVTGYPCYWIIGVDCLYLERMEDNL